ncbi:hypothetical protein PIB30_017263 [Stylosanthes scabra]|uniref:Uncharacterized protein n=1 Tax=Stylosanthes scabra TaxID=79078 RepID=A0ABU6Q889_9FABA|nr:hypothetical protein [Stylosanthes scabra]
MREGSNHGGEGGQSRRRGRMLRWVAAKAQAEVEDERHRGCWDGTQTGASHGRAKAGTTQNCEGISGDRRRSHRRRLEAETRGKVRWIYVASGYQIAFNFYQFPFEQLPAQCQQKKLWSTLGIDLRCPPNMKLLMSALDVEFWGKTVLHCLNHQCPFASEIWNQSDLREITKPDDSTIFLKWWLDLMENLRKQTQWRKKSSIFTAILWKLWHDRNLRIFEGVATSVDSTLSAATDDS